MSPSAAPLTKFSSASGWALPARAQGLMKKGAEKLWPRILVLNAISKTIAQCLILYIRQSALDVGNVNHDTRLEAVSVEDLEVVAV